MARHISTKDILEHFKSAFGASVNGTIYKTITVDDKNLTIGPIVFPLDYFDIGGVNHHTFHLMDSEQKYHDIMLLKKDGYKMDHPSWKSEEFQPERIRNQHLTNKYRP